VTEDGVLPWEKGFTIDQLGLARACGGAIGGAVSVENRAKKKILSVSSISSLVPFFWLFMQRILVLARLDHDHFAVKESLLASSTPLL